MTRRPIALLFAATVAVLAFAAAGSAAATLPFNVSMTVEAGTLPTGCCADSTTGLPTVVVVPGIGRATLTAEFFVCGVVGCFPDGFSSLSLQFATPSGDTLWIVGTGTLATPENGAGAWSVSSASTGRFAGATGAGIYTASVIVTGTSTGGPAPSELTFSLTGTITRR
jgi:hypothetical protein